MSGERRPLWSLAVCVLLIATGCSSSGTKHRAITAEVACSKTIGQAVDLPDVRTASVTVSGSPFDVVTTADGAWSFVSLATSIGVFSRDSLVPRLVGQVPMAGQPLGEILTTDGRYLVVADQSGVDVIDVAAAKRGDPDPVAGVLRPPGGATSGGAIEVALSRDDRYAFVTRENDDDLAVFDLTRARLDGYRSSAFVGSVSLGTSPVGIALSRDGHWLYATSQAGAPPGASPAGPSLGPEQGTLSVVKVATAVSDPANAVLTSVAAGCNPVRVISSTDGKTLWVTARASNALLGFSSTELRTDPRHALVARVPVGQAPVGVALVRHDTRLIVANPNRFSDPGSSGNLSVIDAGAALGGRPSVLGVVPSGTFPREFALGPDGRVLLVTNYASNELEAIDVATLP
ncbi:MAG: YncE family protein [Actinomycetota bacterium]|nr:YncE family protein [Actinomycetota bacterium]